MTIMTGHPPATGGRLARFVRLVDKFERDEIEAAVDALIAYLDEVEGDLDLEDNTGEEDAFETHSGRGGYGAGCGLADPDHGAEEGGDASTWPEWQTLHPSRRRAGHLTGKSRDKWNDVVLDDTEDDDRDEVNGDEIDGHPAEDEFMVHAFGDRGPGCSLSDPGGIAYREEDGHP